MIIIYQDYFSRPY